MPRATKTKPTNALAVKTPTKQRTKKPLPYSPSSSEDMPKAAKSKTKVRGDKKKKDPNAPKRGLSAYMFYANANRERVRSENADITFGQVGKVLGEEWKSLEPAEKEKYEEMARKDKKRYEDEKAKYNAAEDDDEGSD